VSLLHVIRANVFAGRTHGFNISLFIFGNSAVQSIVKAAFLVKHPLQVGRIPGLGADVTLQRAAAPA
jgi:hypothetical protein